MIKKILVSLIISIGLATNIYTATDIKLGSMDELQNILKINAGKPFFINFSGLYQPGAAINHNAEMQPAADQGNLDLGPIINFLTIKPSAFGLRFTLNKGTSEEKIYALWLTCSNGNIVKFDIQNPSLTPNQSSIPSWFIEQLKTLKNTSPFIWNLQLPSTPPPSGNITLDALDTYLSTVTTAPTFNIKNNSWYGTTTKKITTTIVHQSLQQYAKPTNITYKKVFAFPTNMNQYFGNDPAPGFAKNLYIAFTMNGIGYNMNITEGTAYTPRSKYIFKIPNNTPTGAYVTQPQ